MLRSQPLFTKTIQKRISANPRIVIVPIMLFVSSLIMAFAWLGHLRFEGLPFAWATLACWLLVLPEYFLNILAIRLGHNLYTGAQMASFNLSSGVVCVALISRFFLGEHLSLQQLFGFGLMIIAMTLIFSKSPLSTSNTSAIAPNPQELS